MEKQKVYLLVESLVQLSNLITGFTPILLLLIDFYFN